MLQLLYVFTHSSVSLKMEADAIDITDASQETADQAAVKQLPVFRNSQIVVAHNPPVTDLLDACSWQNSVCCPLLSK